MTSFFCRAASQGLIREKSPARVPCGQCSDAMKKALYAGIAANLERCAGVRPQDVFIFMHENDYSDWSVGNGKFAMALQQQRGDDA